MIDSAALIANQTQEPGIESRNLETISQQQLPLVGSAQPAEEDSEFSILLLSVTATEAVSPL